MEDIDLDGMLREAMKKADQAEVYFENSEGLLLKSVLDKIESVDSRSTSGYSLRVIKDGRLGFSFFSSASEFKKALENALYSAKFSRKLNMSFPQKQKYSKVRGLYSKKLEEITEDELSDILLNMIDASKKYRAHPTENFISLRISEYLMINSNGGGFKDKYTFLYALSASQYKESTSGAYNSLRKMFDIEKIAERSSILAEKFAGAKPTKGEYDIILHPNVVIGLLGQVFEGAIDGEEIFRKNSYFADKINKKVANENVTIYDDPEIPYGPASDYCDTEGTSKQIMKIVDKGIFVNPLYDLEAAYLAGKKSTGNGFKSDFTSLPGIMTTNVRMESKEREKLEEINGVFIYDVMGVHNINSANGDFALEIGNGCFFKDYETKEPIRKCSIVGNYFDLLQNFRLADDDQQLGSYYGPSWIYKGKII